MRFEEAEKGVAPLLLEEIGKDGPPLLCLEVTPPKGVNTEKVFSRLDGNVEGIDFFNVTDSALARMKSGALPFAAILKDRYGIEPMVNISCRDRNLIALQSDLLGGWLLGVRSIVALTGDAMSIGDTPDGKGVFEVNSVGLLEVVEKMNQGTDRIGGKLNGAPDYYSGVVVNPSAKNPAAEIRKLGKKKAAGAKYALSQPVFDLESSRQFFEDAAEVGVPIFMGLLPFSTGQAVINMNKIPGINVPEELLSQAEKDPKGSMKEFSLEHCERLVEANLSVVRGVHVISGATPKLALNLTKRLVGLLKQDNRESKQESVNEA